MRSDHGSTGPHDGATTPRRPAYTPYRAYTGTAHCATRPPVPSSVRPWGGVRGSRSRPGSRSPPCASRCLSPLRTSLRVRHSRRRCSLRRRPRSLSAAPPPSPLRRSPSRRPPRAMREARALTRCGTWGAKSTRACRAPCRCARSRGAPACMHVHMLVRGCTWGRCTRGDARAWGCAFELAAAARLLEGVVVLARGRARLLEPRVARHQHRAHRLHEGVDRGGRAPPLVGEQLHADAAAAEHVARLVAQPRAQHVHKGRRVGVVGREVGAHGHALEAAQLEVGGDGVAAVEVEQAQVPPAERQPRCT